MNLTEVIELFQSKRKGSFSQQDRETIMRTMSELGLSQFDIKYRHDVITKSGEPYSIYFHDVDDIVHVHSTMVVARTRFSLAESSKVSRYARYPYIAILSHWVSIETTEPLMCPNCFLILPLIGMCDQCGFDVDDNIA